MGWKSFTKGVSKVAKKSVSKKGVFGSDGIGATAISKKGVLGKAVGKHGIVTKVFKGGKSIIDKPFDTVDNLLGGGNLLLYVGIAAVGAGGLYYITNKRS